MITNQACIFAIFIIVGIIIGILFDIFRVLRKSIKTNDIITYIQDILFCILTGIILLYAIFMLNNGEIRIYMFLAIFFGILMYILTISKYFININVWLLTHIIALFKKILNILSIPFKLLVKLFKKISNPISFIIINVRKHLSKFVTKPKKIQKGHKI